MESIDKAIDALRCDNRNEEQQRIVDSIRSVLEIQDESQLNSLSKDLDKMEQIISWEVKKYPVKQQLNYNPAAAMMQEL